MIMLIVTLIHAWLLYVVVLAVAQRFRPEPPPPTPRIPWDDLKSDDLEWVDKHMRLWR